MTINRCRLAGTVVAAVVLVLGVAAPSQAATSQVVVKSVQLQRGAVVVDVRLHCHGGGRMYWDVGISQSKRQASAHHRYRCNGDIARRTVTLLPSRGRFHPGEAALTYGAVGPCTGDVCIGWGVGRMVDLSYRPPTAAVSRPGA